MIDVDFQFLMRIFLGIRIEENYENDERISKHNCVYRKDHSIASAILEKILILDLAKRAGEPFACTKSDL